MKIKRVKVSDLMIELEIEKKLITYISREKDFFEYYTHILLIRDMLQEQTVFDHNKYYLIGS